VQNTIRIARAKHNWTQAELAEKVGVSRQTINSIEIGRYIPSTLLALKIASVFETPLGELFSLEEKDWDTD
jgi:putative transcriptional regulator